MAKSLKLHLLELFNWIIAIVWTFKSIQFLVLNFTWTNLLLMPIILFVPIVIVSSLIGMIMINTQNTYDKPKQGICPNCKKLVTLIEIEKDFEFRGKIHKGVPLQTCIHCGTNVGISHKACMEHLHERNQDEESN